MKFKLLSLALGALFAGPFALVVSADDSDNAASSDAAPYESVARVPRAEGIELAFEQSLQGVQFTASSPNNSSLNTVILVALAGDVELLNESIEVDGRVSGVEVADIDANGFPEIYLYVNSAGSGSYGSLTAYASNRNRSMTPIYLPTLDSDPALATGYMGHDEFTVGEGALLRRFPLYLEGDTNAGPSGGMRQIQYHLEAGEATWTLTPIKVSEY